MPNLALLIIIGCLIVWVLNLLFVGVWLIQRFDEEKVVERFKRFLEAEDWHGAAEYCNNREMMYIKQYVLKMLEVRRTPWRILYVYEEARLKLRTNTHAATYEIWTYRVLSLVWVWSIIFGIHAVDPNHLKWVMWGVIGIAINHAMIIGMSTALVKASRVLLMIRNRLFEAIHYIPPEFMPREMRADDHDRWREALGRIERSVLHSKNIEKATNEEIERIKTRHQAFVESGDEDLPASSRLGMLMGGNDNEDEAVAN